MPGQARKARPRRRKSDERFITLRLLRNTDDDLAEWWASLPPEANGSALIKEALRAAIAGRLEGDSRSDDIADLRTMIEGLVASHEALGNQVAELSSRIAQGVRVSPATNGSQSSTPTPELDPDVADQRRKQILGRKW
jgi:hypothetical protein